MPSGTPVLVLCHRSQGQPDPLLYAGSIGPPAVVVPPAGDVVAARPTRYAPRADPTTVRAPDRAPAPMRQGGAMYFVGIDLAWGGRRPTGRGRPRRAGPPAACLGRDHRRVHRRGARTVPTVLPGRHRCAAGRRQRHRQPPLRGRAQPRLRRLPGGRPSLEHRQARVQRPAAGGSARGHPRAGHRPGLDRGATRHRGLPPSGDRCPVLPRPDHQVQEQAGAAAHPAADRDAAADEPPGGPGEGQAGPAPARLARLGPPRRRRRGRHPQERAARGGGPGRRGGLRLHRPVRPAGPRPDDDLRRPRIGLHHHANPARGPDTAATRG